ncbi:t-SNARE [Crepidotus variabilis]|uniref:t-SNARE n=1 Tax=Crepidotus variabilis TaxID=179855 RepID=A0A9P6EN47_9AGAR|nr:t-SNARE [Crepidotus variabilis]
MSTTRSRTSLFLSYRDSQAPRRRRTRTTAYESTEYHDDENEHLIQASSHVSVDIPSLPPKWVDISDQVEEVIANVQAKIQTLDKLHAKHVLPGFADRSQEERDIESLTTGITKDFRTCQSLIQRISSQPHAFPPDPQKSNHETLAGKNVQRGLAAKVQDLSATFRKKQRVYMEKLSGHAAKNQDLLVASGAIHLKGSDGLSAVDDDIQAVTQQSLVHADPSHELASRDRELSEIAKSIASLAELFKDLSVLVIDQGTLLDSVEYNIEQTAVQMEDAVTELKIATRYQKNTGKRKCIFLLLLIIFGLIFILIFKPKRHHTTPPPPQPSTVIPRSSIPLLSENTFTIPIPRTRPYPIVRT